MIPFEGAGFFGVFGAHGSGTGTLEAGLHATPNLLVQAGAGAAFAEADGRAGDFEDGAATAFADGGGAAIALAAGAVAGSVDVVDSEGAGSATGAEGDVEATGNAGALASSVDHAGFGDEAGCAVLRRNTVTIATTATSPATTLRITTTLKVAFFDGGRPR